MRDGVLIWALMNKIQNGSLEHEEDKKEQRNMWKLMFLKMKIERWVIALGSRKYIKSIKLCEMTNGNN